MGPPPLFIQQLRRAHSIFLLLHDFSLDDLYSRVGRAAFCLFLERFWDKFAWNWELLLTGNPIVEIYDGIKLAAGGELGIGVGEEEWGSGEREVLEDFVSRTDGLLDLVVSRFGDPPEQTGDSPSSSKSSGETQWLGLDVDPRPADGVIFSGLGPLCRRSLAHISHWMEWIYRYGDAAYGVGRDPSSQRRRKPPKPGGRQYAGPGDGSASGGGVQPTTPDRSHTPGIPRPLVTAAPQATSQEMQKSTPERDNDAPPQRDQSTDQPLFGAETVMKYLTLGYGSSWSFSPKSATPTASPVAPNEAAEDKDKRKGRAIDSAHPSPAAGPQSSSHRIEQNSTLGRFVLGPRDDLDTLDDLEEENPEPKLDNGRPKSRIVHRTLHVRLAGQGGISRKLQAVIYVVGLWRSQTGIRSSHRKQHQPFMFMFLFDPDTPSLSSASLYSSIHHQLGPLQKPLLSSTSPTSAATRISMSESTADPNRRSSTRAQQVYDIVYDRSNLTIRSSIPNIPSLATPSHPTQSPKGPRTPSPSPSRPPSAPLWSRIESLAIHQRLLTIYIDTRSRSQELERTCKTSRGWWIVWLRIPPQTQPPSPQTGPTLSTTSSSVALSSMADENPSTDTVSPAASPSSHPREAFIVRKASDYISPASNGRMSSGARFFRDLGGASSSKLGSPRATETTPSKLAEGLGMDARRYIEGLLSLNR